VILKILTMMLSAGALGAVALAPSRAEAQNSAPDVRSKRFLAHCRSEFARVDSAVEKAGAGYAGYHRLIGFPYLRSDRMIASFVDRVGSFDAFDIWTWELRENDGFARNIELSNMGMPDVDRSNLLTDLRLCAVWLSNIELMDAHTLHRVYREAQPPVRYVPVKSEALAALDRDNRTRQDSIRQDFVDARISPAKTAQVVLWTARKTVQTTDPGQVAPDPLGRKGFTPTKWQELAEEYAPNWLIETAGPEDTIGAPTWGADGRAFVDTASPQVYFVPSYARVGTRTLIQINYFVWFSHHLSGSADDPESGPIDGLVWRVTFDSNGVPLMFDAIHMSGFDQMWFVPPSVSIRAQEGDDDDPVLMAQTVTSTEGLTVRLHAGTHTPRQISGEGTVDAGVETKHYEIRSYDDLMTLPFGNGQTRSLFNSKGIVSGTERKQQPNMAGIPYPGAVRHWGDLPTAVSGRHFFDDPGLIDHYFILPASPTESPNSPPSTKEVPTRLNLRAALRSKW
jgi:hypothetical protein